MSSRFEEIIRLSEKYGFDDAQIAPWEGGSVLLLFSKYSPANIRDSERIGISSYYVVSNRAYQKAGRLAEELNGIGIPAKRDASIPARKAALAWGGCMGKNGFYYHPQLGSLVHIQTILLDEMAGPKPKTVNSCADCGQCAAACPCNAITDSGVDYSKCLRKAMLGSIPDQMKPFVYQLYGCEKCQTACPLNKTAEDEPYSFDLASTIKGETLPQIQNLVGKNMARLVRTVNQSIIYAANAGNFSVLRAVEKLAGDERFADACRYYLNSQKKGIDAPIGK